MPLSWNEIRARAARFSEEWKEAHYEKGQTQTFYNEFFEVFGRRRRDVAVYEEKVKKLNDKQGFIDLFWPGNLLIEQKSAGRSLVDAREQATDYFVTIKEQERPRYILLSDFQKFELLDLEENREWKFSLSELAENIRLFGFIAGYKQETYRDQDPANIRATELMSDLHHRLEEANYKGAHLERLLVRIMFCLFADDTGIFKPDSFLLYIEESTSEDGSDVGSKLLHLFEVLDKDIPDRQTTLDERLADFPYVNGELFKERIDTPSFNSAMRASLLQCCYFEWSKVSPALFGSLFQAVMLPEEQRKGGAHYTSEKNILKTIQPLFLDDLREEFAHLKADKSTQRQARLEKFHQKLGALTFLDPACGCGNFLILAYRELRQLELEVLEALHPQKQLVLDVDHLSIVDVDQFYGIEIEEFPARIAEAAMWLVDHQMNMKLSDSFGKAFARLPLRKSAHIVHDNALRIDWKDVIAPDKLNYILGNPPFVGKKEQTVDQKKDMALVFGNLKSAGVLDYVSSWYWKAAEYIQNTKIKAAFVSTNSITQGEQVAVLWKPLLERLGIHIHFAHRTFKWTIDEKKAKGMEIANVHVVIIGFASFNSDIKNLFEYETITSEPHSVVAKNINPYLIDAPDIVIGKLSKPLCSSSEMVFGTKLVDDGHLVCTTEEKEKILQKYPSFARYFRQLIGGEEFINNTIRWCLWLVNAEPSDIKSCPPILERIEKVRQFRLASKKAPTVKLASLPAIFGEIRQPSENYLLVPKVSSENRKYIPTGYCDKNIIANGSALIVPNASFYEFGVIQSAMHATWMRQTAGRMKSDYQYSASIVYNNFPWPEADEVQQQDIATKAQAVLDARLQFPGSTLADLYNPLTMPDALLKAHQALDKAVDKAYRKEPFASERERVEYLFGLYQKLTAPLLPEAGKKKRKISKNGW